MEQLDPLPDNPNVSDVEKALRYVAVGYGDYPDSVRCRIDTLQQGIKYR